jgi:plastocyanin
MMTGDHARTAAAVASQAGIDPSRVLAGIAPGDKSAAIERLQQAGHVVAMVGDGLNDAPALARADVGLAMASGTDVAMEASSFTLLRADLGAVPDALSLARRTLQVVRQNLFWAFAYNVVLIPVAAGVLVPLLREGAPSARSRAGTARCIPCSRPSPWRYPVSRSSCPRYVCEVSVPRYCIRETMRPMTSAITIHPTRRVRDGSLLKEMPDASDVRCSRARAARRLRAGRSKEVQVSVTDMGFEPEEVTIAKGQAAVVVMTRKSDNTCATQAVFAETGKKYELPLNTPVRIDLTNVSPGTVHYACGMDMEKGTIVIQ